MIILQRIRITKRILSTALATLIAGSMFAVPALAEEAYDGYLYDWWNEAIPSQTGYVPERQVTGNDLGIGDFKVPLDIFATDEGDFYVADSEFETNFDDGTYSKGRIVKIDNDMEKATAVFDRVDLSEVGDWLSAQKERFDSGEIDEIEYNAITAQGFNIPAGVYVTPDDMLYVADSKNRRVIAGYQRKDSQGNDIFVAKYIYIRPDEKDYDENVAFEPTKVVVDRAKNVYANVKSITKGAVEFSETGEFNRYFGANRVKRTAEVLASKVWQFFMTEEQLQKSKKNVSAEFSNFDIDDDNFIYTVTEVKSADIDVLKKVSPKGTNVFESMGISDTTFGDFYSVRYRDVTYSSQIIDVDISENGLINLLDAQTGRVFVYDQDCLLLYIYGGLGNQKGTFTTPKALETYGDKSYVLDMEKANITIFKQTEFGAIVNDAIELYSDGKYTESMELWDEVLRRDNNYWFAYVAIGNAYLFLGEYDKAMDYFYMNSRGGYNQAFRNFRMEYVRNNFSVILGIILAVIIIPIVIKKVIKISKKLKQKKGAA